jgi:hypothetical protein
MRASSSRAAAEDALRALPAVSVEPTRRLRSLWQAQTDLTTTARRTGPRRVAGAAHERCLRGRTAARCRAEVRLEAAALALARARPIGVEIDADAFSRLAAVS